MPELIFNVCMINIFLFIIYLLLCSMPFFLLALLPVSLVPEDIISISFAFLFESGLGLSNLPNFWINSLLLDYCFFLMLIGR